jgi:hypothetical protein
LLHAGGGTTRKKATRSAWVLVICSACPMRCGYYATSNMLPVAHGVVRYG